MKLFLVLMIFVLSSCSGIKSPGNITVEKSTYDDETEVSMLPAWAHDEISNSLRIGAIKSSDMNKDEAILIVSSLLIRDFSKEHPNLTIKIGRKKVALSPLSFLTECSAAYGGYAAHCFQKYKVKVSLIKKMTKSKNVRFKVMFKESFTTGSLNYDGPEGARRGLKNFINKIEKTTF